MFKYVLLSGMKLKCLFFFKLRKTIIFYVENIIF